MPMSEENYWTRTLRGRVSRRTMIRGAALGGAGLAGAALIGCGGDDDDDDDTAATTGAATAAPSGGTTAAASLPNVSIDDFRSMPMSELREIYNPAYLKNLPGQVEALKNGPTWGGTYYKYKDGPTTWDVLGAGAAQLTTQPGMHNQLLRYQWDADFGPHHEIGVVADLPEGWEQPDSLTHVFKLPAEPIYWHDFPPVNGRQFTAEDLAWGLNALKDAPVQGEPFRDVDSINVVDASTVTIKFNTPAAYFPISSTIPTMWLTAQEHVESADGLAQWPIGTGAFQLVEAANDINAIYERNPRYWKKDPLYGTGKNLPYLDRIEGTYMPDSATTEAAWAAGAIDYAPSNYGPRRLVANMIEARPDAVVMVVAPPPSYQMLLVQNTKTPPFDDVRVRRALSMAIDRPAMIEGLAGGFAGPGYSQNYAFFDRPENPWPYTFEELGPNLQFNLPEAKKLLAAAGFAEGAGLGRTIELGWSYTDAGYNSSVYTAMSDMLRQNLGIDLEINMAVDYPSYAARLFGPEYQDIHVATTWTAWDPDGFSYGQLHSKSPNNYYTVDDPLLDELTLKQQTELDLDERRAILMKIMERDLDQAYRNWGLMTYKWTIRNPKLFNVGDHYLAWQTGGWGEYQLGLAWKQA